MRVSKDTKASIDCTAMDAQLEALRRRNPPPVRIESSDRSSARFLSRPCFLVTLYMIIRDHFPHRVIFSVGRNSVLDTACDLLAPELRPVAPQPNCPQSMKIYEDHRNVSCDLIMT